MIGPRLPPASTSVLAVPRSGLVAGRPPLRVGRFSGVWRPRMIGVTTLVGLAMLVLVVALNVGLGDFPIPVLHVLGVPVGLALRCWCRSRCC
ncbi:MAG TPA: hypothetical protein VFQ48_01855 [Pseudonocardiaceae bacterium]|nr:hypothetical protein [Pseudonocardiaceae bacterium]